MSEAFLLALTIISDALTIGDVARLMMSCQAVRNMVQRDPILFKSIARGTFRWQRWQEATYTSLVNSIRKTKRCGECGAAVAFKCRMADGSTSTYCKRCTEAPGGFRQLVSRVEVKALALQMRTTSKSPATLLNGCTLVRATRNGAFLYWAHEVTTALHARRRA